MGRWWWKVVDKWWGWQSTWTREGPCWNLHTCPALPSLWTSFNTSKESTNLLTALFLGFSINLQHNLTPAYPMGPGDGRGEGINVGIYDDEAWWSGWKLEAWFPGWERPSKWLCCPFLFFCSTLHGRAMAMIILLIWRLGRLAQPVAWKQLSLWPTILEEVKQKGFPGGSVGKEPACNERDARDMDSLDMTKQLSTQGF